MPRWKKGECGNPRGRPVDQLRPLARKYTMTAISALVSIVRSKRAATAARVRACEVLLARGWGHPIQPSSFVDVEGLDRPLPSALPPDPLDTARRISFLLAEGLRAAARPESIQLQSQTIHRTKPTTRPHDQHVRPDRLRAGRPSNRCKFRLDRTGIV